MIRFLSFPLFFFIGDVAVPTVARYVSVDEVHPEKLLLCGFDLNKNGNFPTLLGDFPNNLSCF